MALNGYRIDPEAKDAYEFLLRVASGGASESEVEDRVATNLTESKSEQVVMAQRLRIAKGIPDEEFNRNLETALKEDKKHLDMLAKV